VQFGPAFAMQQSELDGLSKILAAHSEGNALLLAGT
jgi:hypothetical protein